MENTSTRRGFTQKIFYTGNTMSFTSPLEGEDVRRTDEGETNGNTYLFGGEKDTTLSPHPAFGHPLPQGARKTTHGGFTLLELLVVVLIMGILAAVAVPQYQKAVEKTRLMEAVSLLKMAADDESIYHLQNGSYANSFPELDTVPCPSYNPVYPDLCAHSFYILSLRHVPNTIYAYRREAPANFGYIYVAYHFKTKRMGCSYNSPNTLAEKVCKTLGVEDKCPWDSSKTCYMLN